MRRTVLFHHPLAAMIALTLCGVPALPAHADTAAQCDTVGDTDCETSQASGRGGLSAWWIGGIVAVAAGATGAAGGGGSNGGGNGGGNGGSGPVPGQEGGQFGDRQTLVAAGGESVWNQPVDTRIIGNARNDGHLALNAGSLTVRGNGHLHNHGTLRVGEAARLVIERDGDLDNRGQLDLRGSLHLQADASLENFGRLSAQGARITLDGDAEIDNHGDMQLRDTLVVLQGDSDFDNGERQRPARLVVDGGGFVLGGAAGFENHGTLHASGALNQGSLIHATTARVGNDRDTIDAFNNHGSIVLDADARVLTLLADTHASTGINRVGGQITSHARNHAALHAEGASATLLNQGTLTVTGDHAVAMSGARGATLINDGTINLGIAGAANGQHLVAMRSDGSATLNNRRGGVINIHADHSHAFQSAGGGSGRLINNGQVNVYGSGSGINADAATAAVNRPGADLGWQAPRGISGYTVGTNADGSAGRMALHQGGHLADVAVDTGFTRGTAASQVHLPGVFTGADSGEDNIRSATVVWRAQAERDASGNVDVVMTRNDYRALADASVQGVAAALEAGYGNSALFHSLEVADTAEFNRALHQLSGGQVMAASQRLAANGEAFWSSLARSAPTDGHHLLAFGPGADTRYGVQGVGSGLQLAVPMQGGRHLQMMSGLLSTDVAHDGGQTRSQSRFAGVGIGQSLGAFRVQHTLGNEWHRMDGQRQLQWGATHTTAHSRRALSRTRIGSMLSRDVVAAAVHWQPRLGVTAFHTREAAFHEHGADTFGLSVGAGTRRGVQWEAGTGAQARVGSAWTVRGDAALIGSVKEHARGRLAYLHGAAGHAFELPGRTSGVDYRVMIGADYRRQRLALGGAVLAQRLLGTPDTQAQMHLNYVF